MYELLSKWAKLIFAKNLCVVRCVCSSTTTPCLSVKLFRFLLLGQGTRYGGGEVVVSDMCFFHFRPDCLKR